MDVFIQQSSIDIKARQIGLQDRSTVRCYWVYYRTSV